jgi:hypothetical protein
MTTCIIAHMPHDPLLFQRQGRGIEEERALASKVKADCKLSSLTLVTAFKLPHELPRNMDFWRRTKPPQGDTKHRTSSAWPWPSSEASYCSLALQARRFQHGLYPAQRPFVLCRLRGFSLKEPKTQDSPSYSFSQNSLLLLVANYSILT